MHRPRGLMRPFSGRAPGTGAWRHNQRPKPRSALSLKDGETLESALRRFKRKVLREDLIKEIKRHAFYLKPGQKKRVKEALPRKRARKKRSRTVIRIEIDRKPGICTAGSTERSMRN
jgi:small subunit ribosomal protein S21